MLYKNSKGKEQEFKFSEHYILSSDYLLISAKYSELSENYNQDFVYDFGSSGLSSSGGELKLYQDEELLDELCWGTASCENHHEKFKTKPEQNQSLVRCSTYKEFENCAKDYVFTFQDYQPEPGNTKAQQIKNNFSEDSDIQLSQTETENISRALDSVQTKELKSCPAGKYRNPLTNRCKNIEASSSHNTDFDSEKTCPTGQYRNPETGRCKNNKTSTITAVKECKAGYERNPETNRCRKIKTETNNLKPCKDGYERNPETNRCRKKIATNSGTNHPVNQDDSIKNEKPTNLIAFSSFSVAAIAATAYTGYQFRHKIRKLIFREGN